MGTQEKNTSSIGFDRLVLPELREFAYDMADIYLQIIYIRIMMMRFPSRINNNVVCLHLLLKWEWKVGGHLYLHHRH